MIYGTISCSLNVGTVRIPKKQGDKKANNYLKKWLKMSCICWKYKFSDLKAQWILSKENDTYTYHCNITKNQTLKRNS